MKVQNWEKKKKKNTSKDITRRQLLEKRCPTPSHALARPRAMRKGARPGRVLTSECTVDSAAKRGTNQVTEEIEW